MKVIHSVLYNICYRNRVSIVKVSAHPSHLMAGTRTHTQKNQRERKTTHALLLLLLIEGFGEWLVGTKHIRFPFAMKRVRNKTLYNMLRLRLLSPPSLSISMHVKRIGRDSRTKIWIIKIDL